MKSIFCCAAAGTETNAAAAAMTSLRMKPPRRRSGDATIGDRLLNMHRPLPPEIAALLRRGTVIPAHPLALNARRKLDERRQRALARYYLDAGSGGIAVGVHATQFAIREAGLYEPVLRIAAEEATTRKALLIAGLSGKTDQAKNEAQLAASLGYHAGMLSLAPMKGASIGE